MSRVRTVAAAEIFMLTGLLAYVAITYGLERSFAIDGAVHLGSISAVVLAGIPALIWLGYFYSQDRLEADPKPYVFGSYILGAFVAGPCATFLVGVAMSEPSSGMRFSALTVERWILAIAIIGVAQEFCKYIVIRYALYHSPEFDEPIDGIIYFSAAGIGFATYESVLFIGSSGGEILLSRAAAQCVVITLAHASLAGVLGYALARAKFSLFTSTQRSINLVLGLLAAAVLNGAFRMILDGLSVQGMSTSPWRRVFFSFGFAAGVFILIAVLMRRLLMASHQASMVPKTEEVTEGETSNG